MQNDRPTSVLLAPGITNPAADARFRALAADMALNPDDRWVGGYVAVEWDGVRHLLSAYAGDLAGRALLEFGCNYAASSIVAAAMGANVTAVDVDADAIALAELNTARHGLASHIDLCHVPDTRRLPFENARFDIILCISVLEYVATDHLDQVLMEIDRVLKPGGLLLVSGTASRIAPREVHSGRWLVNYWPIAVDRFLGHAAPLQRGLNPFRVMRAFRAYRNIDLEDGGARWTRARAAMGQPPARLAFARKLARVLRLFGLSIGIAGSSFSAAWQKPTAQTAGRQAS
jgi:SAM-dependent methyltransferase